MFLGIQSRECRGVAVRAVAWLEWGACHFYNFTLFRLQLSLLSNYIQNLMSKTMSQTSQTILVKKSKLHDRGVFANRNFNVGDVIEICPVIVLSVADRKKIDKTYLYNVYFSWKEKAAIGLGFSSIYNHCYDPNARYAKKYGNRTLVYTAIKPIRRGEEITSNYNGTPTDMTPVWLEKKR